MYNHDKRTFWDDNLLNPCPCCGGKAKIKYVLFSLPEQTYVQCKQCKFKTKNFSISTRYFKKNPIVEIWNTLQRKEINYG